MIWDLVILFHLESDNLWSLSYGFVHHVHFYCSGDYGDTNEDVMIIVLILMKPVEEIPIWAKSPNDPIPNGEGDEFA